MEYIARQCVPCFWLPSWGKIIWYKNDKIKWYKDENLNNTKIGLENKRIQKWENKMTKMKKLNNTKIRWKIK